MRVGLLRRIRSFTIAACAMGMFASVPVAGAAAQTTPGIKTETGYVKASDGTQLHYIVNRPDTGAAVPAVLEYNGYGAQPHGVLKKLLPSAGYALVTVHLRGSGCSEGVWELPTRRQAEDGYEVIEWIAQQPWSDGRVAMAGESYTAFIQSYVAALDPPHLVAMAPLNSTWDLYRDVLYPGGIYNPVVAAAFGHVAQPAFSAAGAQPEIAKGDTECAANQAERPANNINSPLVHAQAHPFDDDYWARLAPRQGAQSLDVPLLTVMSWPDDALGSRGVHMLSELDALGKDFHAILTDGAHSMLALSPGVQDELVAFLDYHVKGESNGYDEQPRIKVWWEFSTTRKAPGWVTDIGQWPPPQMKPEKYFLSEGGALRPDEPGSGSADPYAYAPGTGQSRVAWSAGPGPGVGFTTAPLARDLVTLGTASADLWLASTAVDTDVQVTLSEVRTDGKEILVQQGWLRASHRTLDETRSTATMPYHTHLASDALESLLTPLKPELLRVEINPFGHVFREGSRVRLRVEAPRAADWLWGFEALPVPATNFVYHDAERPSALVLPVLPGVGAEAPLPACAELVLQPCR